MTRRLLFALAALAIAACDTSTPTQRAWPLYSAEVKKILAAYDDAMLEVANVDVALQIIPGSEPGSTPMKPEEAISKLEKEVIPRLDKAATHAASISIPNSSRLTAMHRPLSESLAAKADAYKMMCTAFKKKDTAEFDKGVAKLTEASNLLSGFRREYGTAVIEGGPRE